ncbi:LD-carboxypeptidase [Halobacillus kuroshimensis]|uniref:LD-carboxypeptidase n=1 Tax=Halobacillus kuroshimensis TaxID=302481 RepID=A0ABS3DSD6_9BACI|nr:LD-carboxypeptidase [Halobacillus kuroshimensis]MBN8234226.1 LD-carboxypeptidase [Halobacillus kuroshimensis]
MQKPKRLQKGDTVGVIAPASPPDLTNLSNALPFLHSLGLNVMIGPNVKRTYGYLAGTDRERVNDLHQMFRDPAIKGIFCAGGGYGTSRLAASIDYNMIRRNPKVFWGYSDITFLHTAIQRQADLVTFHGPMLSSDVGKPDFDDRSKQRFTQLFHPETFTYTNETSPLQVISRGTASGRLVGGNLSLLVNSIGSPYEIDTKNRLLLIEDVGEEPYRIDSFLSQLKLAGKLDEASGIVVGDFSETEPKKKKETIELQEVFRHYFADLQKPVLSGFRIGHCLPHYAVPLGVEAELCSSGKYLRIAAGVQ